MPFAELMGAAYETAFFKSFGGLALVESALSASFLIATDLLLGITAAAWMLAGLAPVCGIPLGKRAGKLGRLMLCAVRPRARATHPIAHGRSGPPAKA